MMTRSTTVTRAGARALKQPLELNTPLCVSFGGVETVLFEVEEAATQLEVNTPCALDSEDSPVNLKRLSYNAECGCASPRSPGTSPSPPTSPAADDDEEVDAIERQNFVEHLSRLEGRRERRRMVSATQQLNITLDQTKSSSLLSRRMARGGTQ
mmetsp:Transcript_19910/g.46330  ORF Transcript_19910/g.46330 Transcript_19910/m.46330 type:complete len:154 (+) Transcript_19910:108-569(+)